MFSAKTVGNSLSLVLFALVAALLPSESFAQTPPKLAEPYLDFPRDAEMEKKTLAELIDALEKIKQPTLDVWTSSGSDDSPIYPPFQELTRRGTAAVPELLKHLDDPRKTSLEKIGDHEITVGDLCYAALGQIVNERYLVFVTTWKFGGEFHSPTEEPSLVKSVREKWNKLTPATHEKLLVTAALRTDPYVDFAALHCLCRYYPQTAEDTAVRLLSRPLYEHERLYYFLLDLGEEPDESKWHGMIEAYVRENGEVVRDLIPFWIQWYYFETSIGWKPGEKERAAKIMQKFYPKFKRHAPVHLAVDGVQGQAGVVGTLKSFKSSRVDAAISDLFHKAKDLKFATRPGFMEESYYFDEFAKVCFDRLRETKYGDEFRVYFLARVAALEAQTPKKWHEIDEWHKLATGKRKTAPPTAEQLQAAVALRALGFLVDGFREDVEYADEVSFFPGDDKKPFPAAAFPQIAKLTAIRELLLGGPEVTDAGMAHLDSFSKLEDVRLENTKITGAALSYLTKSKNLRVLDISHSAVDDAGLAHVAKFERLEELNLARTKVTGKGLAHLRDLKNLKKLDLTGCRRVSEGDLENIGKLNELTDLTLEVPEVGDAGLKQLYGLAKLQNLTLLFCRATPQGITALRAKLPKTTVAYYWEFQLKETPEGVLLTSPQLTVLFEQATLPIDRENLFETGIWSGDEPRPAQNKDGIGGGIKLSGGGNLAFSVGTDEISVGISNQDDVTNFSLDCPRRGASDVKLKYRLTLTKNGGTLRSGDDTFDLQTPKRIRVGIQGKAKEMPAN